MTLEQAFQLKATLDKKDCIKLLNEIIVIENILKGLYRDEDDPLSVAKDDLSVMNGEKLL